MFVSKRDIYITAACFAKEIFTRMMNNGIRV